MCQTLVRAHYVTVLAGRPSHVLTGVFMDFFGYYVNMVAVSRVFTDHHNPSLIIFGSLEGLYSCPPHVLKDHGSWWKEPPIPVTECFTERLPVLQGSRAESLKC